MSFLIAPSFINLKEISTTGVIAPGMLQDGPEWPGDDSTSPNSVTIGASETNDYYTFTGLGLTGISNNPEINLVRGGSYTFTNTMDKHPFRIQRLNGTIYNTGIIGNTVKNGTLYWTVAYDTPDTLNYQCTVHGSMRGTINISGEDPTPDSDSEEEPEPDTTSGEVQVSEGTVSWSNVNGSNIVKFNVTTNSGYASVIEFDWKTNLRPLTVSMVAKDGDIPAAQLYIIGTDSTYWSFISGPNGISGAIQGTDSAMGPFEFQVEFPTTPPVTEPYFFSVLLA